MLGEFERVAHVVEQGLPQPGRVAAQRFGKRLRIDRDLQPLAPGLFVDQGLDVFEQRRELEIGVLQLNPSGFDLGKIEDVVDDREQVLAGALDLLHPHGLLLRQPRAQDQVGEPEDGVHRGADFVAHVGKESALAARRPLRLVGPPGQLALHGGQHLLARLALAVVDHRAARVLYRAVRVVHEIGADQGGEARTVAAHELQLGVPQQPFAQKARKSRGEEGPALGGHEISNRPSNDVFARIPEPVELGVIDRQHPAVRRQRVITAGHPVVQGGDFLDVFGQRPVGFGQFGGARLNQLFEVIAMLFEFGIGAFFLAHVHDDAQKALRFAVHPENGLPARHQPAFAFAGVLHPPLDVQFPPRLSGKLRGVHSALAVVRVNTVNPGVKRRCLLPRCQAIEPKDLVRPDVLAGTQVPFPHPGFGGVEGQPQAAFVLAHGKLGRFFLGHVAADNDRAGNLAIHPVDRRETVAAQPGFAGVLALQTEFDIARGLAAQGPRRGPFG